MIVNLPTPPRPTGDSDRDVTALNEWAVLFYRRIVNILRNIDGYNISEVPSSKLRGSIPDELLSPTETAEVYTMSLREENIDVADTEETDTV